MSVDARKSHDQKHDAENIVATSDDNSPLICPVDGWSPTVHLLVIGSAVLATYFGVWRAYFWTDDFWMLGWVRHRPSLADAIWAQFGYAVRFLLDAHLWLRMQLFDLDPTPYYLTSLGQHLLVALLVYLLVRTATSRGAVAVLAATLFATSYTHLTVVTWITGSEYSQAALFYLGTLGAFAAYLETRRPAWLAASLTSFVALLLYLELLLSLPLVLMAYHLLLGRDGRPLKTLRLRELRVHAPYLVLFAAYVALQMAFVAGGASEARVAAERYGAGWHVVPNLYYLVYLVLPPALPDQAIRTVVGQWALDAIAVGSVVLAVAGNVVLAVLFLRGSALVRFAVAFLYLTFLPYLFWEGAFAGANRYRYLPSMAFAVLVAMGTVRLHQRLARWRPGRLVIPVLVLGQLAANVAVTQAWIRRHVRYGKVRRAAVEALLREYPSPEPGSHIVFAVPADRYLDLAGACSLVYAAPMRCEAIVSPRGSAPHTWAADDQAIILHVSGDASVRFEDPDASAPDEERP